jgi:hypothetical protein
MNDLEDLNFHRLLALENIEAHKLRIARYYGRKVKSKQFHEGELVWKLILPMGLKIVRVASGHLIGRGLIVSLDACLAMLTFTKL